MGLQNAGFSIFCGNKGIGMPSHQKKIIGITGEKGKGKTSFVHVLIYLLSINGHSASVLSFADYIKQVARECYGRDIGMIHGKLSKADRELLCKIGDALRSVDPLCLTNVVERKLKLQTSEFVIVGDVRLQREAEMLRKHKGIIVKLDSHIYARQENYLKDHLTETEMSKISHDFLVLNEGTFADLLTEGKKVLSHFYPNCRWKS